MDTNLDQSFLDALVRRIFFVEDITLGSPKQGYQFRYRGHMLSEDTAAAYDQLTDALKPYNLTPLFRVEEGTQVILLVTSQPAPKPGRPGLNLLMFFLTLISVLISGGIFNSSTPLPSDPVQAALTILRTGWPFAVSLLAILASHEFGHYFAGRYHGAKVTLPFFIPLPFTAFGTMGAFINMKAPPKNKRVLMDIAIAGPIVGYIVSIIVNNFFQKRWRNIRRNNIEHVHAFIKYNQ